MNEETYQHLARITHAANRLQAARAEVDPATLRFHHWINEAASNGISQRLIGEAAGVSQQRVAQIVRETRMRT
jgi:hypothetical protein